MPPNLATDAIHWAEEFTHMRPHWGRWRFELFAGALELVSLAFDVYQPQGLTLLYRADALRYLARK